MRCSRCDYRADDLSEHAAETRHYLCVVCQRQSLTEFESQTCGQCIGRVRVDLADILEGYTLLEPATVNAMTLLGDGTMQRRAHVRENVTPKRHPLATPDDPIPPMVRDEWPTDPLPVLPALVSWEDFIREHYREPKGQPDPTLTDVVGYLMGNLDTRHNLAQTFPAFDELAAEIRQHRAVLQHAAGLANDPEEAEADCFDCGSPLIRHYRDLTHDPEQDAAGREHEGRDDHWTCRGCRRVYTPAEYVLAIRARLEAQTEEAS